MRKLAGTLRRRTHTQTTAEGTLTYDLPAGIYAITCDTYLSNVSTYFYHGSMDIGYPDMYFWMSLDYLIYIYRYRLPQLLCLVQICEVVDYYVLSTYYLLTSVAHDIIIVVPSNAEGPTTLSPRDLIDRSSSYLTIIVDHHPYYSREDKSNLFDVIEVECFELDLLWGI